jgi:hypothetical protein
LANRTWTEPRLWLFRPRPRPCFYNDKLDSPIPT